jgi:hypothetical protein
VRCQQGRTKNIKMNNEKNCCCTVTGFINVTEFWDCEHEMYTLSLVGIYISHLFKELKFNLLCDILCGGKELYCGMF